jgi:hypothetical protein
MAVIPAHVHASLGIGLSSALASRPHPHSLTAIAVRHRCVPRATRPPAKTASREADDPPHPPCPRLQTSFCSGRRLQAHPGRCVSSFSLPAAPAEHRRRCRVWLGRARIGPAGWPEPRRRRDPRLRPASRSLQWQHRATRTSARQDPLQHQDSGRAAATRW